MLTAVMRLPTPPEALQSAARMETTSPAVSAPPGRLVRVRSCSLISSAALAGSACVIESICSATVCGEATSP